MIQNVASFANTFGISQPSLDPGNLVVDADGNIFGTTEYGGPNGDGTVFEGACRAPARSTRSVGSTEREVPSPMEKTRTA